MRTFLKNLAQQPLMLGCLIFGFQLLVIIGVCPEKNWGDAWLSMASHWDSEWYQAIAQYGYLNLDGPAHCGLHNANVVFFPGYPYLARGLVLGLNLDPRVALLLVAQAAALGFWCCLFYIVRHLSFKQQFYAAGLILAFPTSWFLCMAYAESLFILSCCMMLKWVTEQRWVGSGLSGILMTATRLIGLPVIAAPLFARCILHYQSIKSAIQNKDQLWIQKELLRPNLIIALGAMGCMGFLIYCACYWGSWHLYFDMERLHWSGTADPFFLFQLPTWLPPPWGYRLDMAPELPNLWAKILPFKYYRVAAYTFSEILVPVFMWLELFFIYRWVKYSRPINEKSFTWFVANLLILLFTCFSLASRHYESMSRCLLPVWVLLVISDALNVHGSFWFCPTPSIIQRVMMGGVLILGTGFWFELLNRFLLGWWVA